MLGPPLGKLHALSVPQVIRTSSFFRHSFVLRHSCFVIRRRETCTPRIEHGTGVMIVRPSRERIRTSLRQVVSRTARRFRALPFLLAMFHPQVPLAEPLLLNRYRPSSPPEIDRDHHLRPLAEDNRQLSG